ncbi:MAG: recombinase family protein [Candidatus Aenigmatarchaeota archaeon]
MKAAIYVRVSTDKQELENQLQPLLEYANRQGYEVVKVYKDIASGKDSKTNKEVNHEKNFFVINFYNNTFNL